MDILERFKSTKQKALENHRPCYSVPQYISDLQLNPRMCGW